MSTTSSPPGADQRPGTAASGTRLEHLVSWASRLQLEDVPPAVVALAKSQLLSQLAAARATLDHDLGRKLTRAFGDPLQDDPKRGAYVLAALTTALDYDDTMFAGHVSHSTVGVPIAFARRAALDGRRLLAAIIAANECAARVTAAATLGPFRGQTAGHAHLAGAVAARLHAERAPSARWAQAIGIAFLMPPWSLTHPFLGSEAKVLTASGPLLTGLDACDAAAAGLRGGGDVLEHPQGFLASFSDVPLASAIDLGLGERWHTESISFKLYPGSAYLDGCVDCAIGLQRSEMPDLRTVEVQEIVVHASIFTVEMDRRSAAYVCGPGSSPIAVTFSVPYNVACALLEGRLGPEVLRASALADPERWALATKVRVEHDAAISARSILATAPIGEALRLAGDGAAAWLRKQAGEQAVGLAAALGEPAESFTAAEKAMAATVEVRLSDGRHYRATCDVPSGAAGSADREEHAHFMREKFLQAGGRADVAARLLNLEDVDPHELHELLGAALAG